MGRRSTFVHRLSLCAALASCTIAVSAAARAGLPPPGGLAQLAAPDGCFKTGGFVPASCTSVAHLDAVWAVETSADGASLYAVTATGGGGVAAFERRPGGALTPRGCVTDDGSGGCDDGVALRGARAVRVGPDGTSVYVVSSDFMTLTYAVAVLARDPLDGSLTQLPGAAGCVAATAAPIVGCATADGLGSVRDLAVSSDGAHVYVASDDGLAVFRRDPATGALTALMGADRCIAATAADGCIAVPEATALTGVVVSPDGAHVYVSSYANGVLGFARNAASGALTRLAGAAGCVSQGGANGCTAGREIGTLVRLAMSTDGRNLYAVSDFGAGIAILARDAATGALAQDPGVAGCVVAGGAGGSCTDAAGLGAPSDVALAPDGATAYVSSSANGSDPFQMNVFERDPDSGALTPFAAPWNCLGDFCAGTVDVLGSVVAVSVSPDGANVYGASSNGILSAFAREVVPVCAGPGPQATTANVPVAVAFACSDANADWVTPVVTVPPAHGTITGLASPGTITYTPSPGFVGADGFSLLGSDGAATSATASVSLTVAAGDDPPAPPPAPVPPPHGGLRALAAPDQCIAEDGLAQSCTDAAGLRGLAAIAPSPDGAYIYAVSADGLAVLSVDTASGALRAVAGAGGCVSATVAGCTIDPRAFDLTAVAVSGDGRFVYAAGGEPGPFASDGVVLVYARDAHTGVVTLVPGAAACLADTTEHGGEPCIETPALGSPQALVMSPDGATMYVGTAGGLVVLARDADSGLLEALPPPDGCLDLFFGPPCRDDLEAGGPVAVSADGRHVYVGTYASADGLQRIAGFSRDPVSGALSTLAGPGSCVTDGSAGVCAASPVLDRVSALGVSADGRRVYAGGSGVAVLDRDPETGLLTPRSCLRKDGSVPACTVADALATTVTALVASPDGGTLHAVSSDTTGRGRRLVTFDVEQTTGALTPLSATAACVEHGQSARCTPHGALDGAATPAMAPDGRWLWLAAARLDAVTALSRELPPRCDDVEVTTAAGRPATLTLVCRDPNGDPLALRVVEPPTRGTVGAVDRLTGAVEYVAGASPGSDDFTFEASDGAETSDLGHVRITVTTSPPANQPPSCTDVSATAVAGTSVTLALPCTDPDGDPLTFEVVSPPGRGALGTLGFDGVVVYTPDTEASGSDAFAFRARDASAASAVQRASIEVTAPERPLLGLVPGTAAYRTRGRLLALPVACTAATGTGCQGEVRLLASRRRSAVRTIGAATVVLGAGTSGTVSLTIDAAAYRRLRRVQARRGRRFLSPVTLQVETFYPDGTSRVVSESAGMRLGSRRPR